MNHVSIPIKDGASKAFKTFKDKVMGLYNRVTGSAGNETRIKGPEPFDQESLSKFSEGLTGPLGLMEDPRYMLICSLTE